MYQGKAGPLQHISQSFPVERISVFRIIHFQLCGLLKTLIDHLLLESLLEKRQKIETPSTLERISNTLANSNEQLYRSKCHFIMNQLNVTAGLFSSQNQGYLPLLLEPVLMKQILSKT